MLNQLFNNQFLELKYERYNHTYANATLLSCVFSHNRDTILACKVSWKRFISPSVFVSNGYISNHNKVRRPRPVKVSFFLYFCCFWINVTQINFDNIKRKLQRIVSDSCFQFKSRFNFDARAPSIPLLNFPFKRKIKSTSLYYMEFVGYFYSLWRVYFVICIQF